MSGEKTRPTNTQVLDADETSFEGMCERAFEYSIWEGRSFVWMSGDYQMNEMIFVRRNGDIVKFYLDGILRYTIPAADVEDIKFTLASWCVNKILITNEHGECFEYFCN